MNLPPETEYNTLRSEIISEMALQTNLRIAMCTIAVAILSFAIQEKSANLCLLVFAILIPFCLIIRGKQVAIMSISAYLIVRYERKYTSLQWESTVSKIRNLENNEHNSNTQRYDLIRSQGYKLASIFGIITAVIHLWLLTTYTFYTVGIVFLLLCITFFVDYRIDSNKIRSDYIKDYERLLK